MLSVRMLAFCEDKLDISLYARIVWRCVTYWTYLLLVLLAAVHEVVSVFP